ncbi:MAG: M28 family peptidase, partial [Candidatus Thorarchaeota archaeon]
MRAAFLTLLIILLSPIPMIPSQTPYSPMFDGENAFSYLTAQCEFGPRPPGSENISLVRGYISDILSAQGWVVFLQNFTYQEVECANIVAVWPERNTSTLILGAHYDTRPRADQESDPTNRMMPVLGANDAASGVAVLLELARILPEESRPFIEIVLFDAEDSGNINGWNWIVGSTYYVDQMSSSKRE